MYTSYVFTFVGLIASGLALPSKSSLSPRACTTILPTSYQQISQSSPYSPYPQGRVFDVSQASNGVQSTDSLVRFTDIPAGSYGCQVATSFTYDYNITSSGNAQLNVYSLGNDIGVGDTYSTYFPGGGKGTPSNGYLWATTTVTGQKAVLNSKACSSEMGFLFEIASSSAAESVQFTDAGDNLSGIGGFYMTYNC